MVSFVFPIFVLTLAFAKLVFYGSIAFSIVVAELEKGVPFLKKGFCFPENLFQR